MNIINLSFCISITLACMKGVQMDKDDHYDITRKRKKLLTKTGFFFWIVIIVPIAIFLTIWFPFHTFFPNETQLMVSHSLNNKNEIEIIRKEDFPDPSHSL